MAECRRPYFITFGFYDALDHGAKRKRLFLHIIIGLCAAYLPQPYMVHIAHAPAGLDHIYPYITRDTVK